MAVWLTWLKLLATIKAFSLKFAVYVQCLVQILLDIRSFIVVLCIVMAAFGGDVIIVILVSVRVPRLCRVIVLRLDLFLAVVTMVVFAAAQHFRALGQLDDRRFRATRLDETLEEAFELQPVDEDDVGGGVHNIVVYDEVQCSLL